jgi:hypothetical protein
MSSAVRKTKAKPEPIPDPSVLIKGYGALKCKLALPDDIDWTKPIYAQVLTREKRHAGHAMAKRRPSNKKARPDVAA